MVKIKQHITNGLALMAMACAIAFMIAGPVPKTTRVGIC